MMKTILTIILVLICNLIFAQVGGVRLVRKLMYKDALIRSPKKDSLSDYNIPHYKNPMMPDPLNKSIGDDVDLAVKLFGKWKIIKATPIHGGIDSAVSVRSRIGKQVLFSGWYCWLLDDTLITNLSYRTRRWDTKKLFDEEYGLKVPKGMCQTVVAIRLRSYDVPYYIVNNNKDFILEREVLLDCRDILYYVDDDFIYEFRRFIALPNAVGGRER